MEEEVGERMEALGKVSDVRVARAFVNIFAREIFDHTPMGQRPPLPKDRITDILELNTFDDSTLINI